MADSADTRRTIPLRVEEPEVETCTIDLRLRLLGQVPFFAGLASGDINQIDPAFQQHSHQAGERIYFAGDPAGRLYVVLVGKVKVVRHTLVGQDVVLDLLGPGEFFGTLSVFGDEEYPDTAHAQTGCCLLSIEAGAFEAIMHRYPPVALAVLHVVHERLRSAQDLIRQLSAQPVEGRIAAALLKLARRWGRVDGERILIETPLSRQDLADMVGTTLETTSRIVSQFRKAGLIESGRQWFAVRDQEGLAAVAGFEGYQQPATAEFAPP